ncbi:MAG: hypothetical protein JWQ11_1465 [Rhizobacter sp.]|nr:hypothetical protein [Rhizobacter sp.]
MQAAGEAFAAMVTGQYVEPGANTGALPLPASKLRTESDAAQLIFKSVLAGCGIKNLGSYGEKRVVENLAGRALEVNGLVAKIIRQKLVDPRAVPALYEGATRASAALWALGSNPDNAFTLAFLLPALLKLKASDITQDKFLSGDASASVADALRDGIAMRGNTDSTGRLNAGIEALDVARNAKLLGPGQTEVLALTLKSMMAGGHVALEELQALQAFQRSAAKGFGNEADVAQSLFDSVTKNASTLDGKAPSGKWLPGLDERAARIPALVQRLVASNVASGHTARVLSQCAGRVESAVRLVANEQQDKSAMGDLVRGVLELPAAGALYASTDPRSAEDERLFDKLTAGLAQSVRSHPLSATAASIQRAHVRAAKVRDAGLLSQEQFEAVDKVLDLELKRAALPASVPAALVPPTWVQLAAAQQASTRPASASPASSPLAPPLASTAPAPVPSAAAAVVGNAFAAQTMHRRVPSLLQRIFETVRHPALPSDRRSAR